MKLCGRPFLSARARHWHLGGEWFVQVKMGGLQYLLDPDEAALFAADIVAAVDRAKAAAAADSDQQPKNGS